ncbi:MAG TPA: class I adenylate-forming enzyme family protein, partial [Pyrinomonadaceae bacterium]|nr:class I adenylate-forming enzyme family protein [Pyrinomonadaceae bacterium]
MIESENMVGQGPPSVEPLNLRELLEGRTLAAPDKLFLFSEADGRRYSYAEFDGAVNAAAHLLASRGVGKGDHVGLLMPNSPEYIIAYFACFKLGAIAGPVNSLLKPQELAYVIADSEAKALVLHTEFQPKIEAIRGQLPDLRHCIEFDDEARSTKEFADAGPPASPSIENGDEAIIIYTSGTTGRPKGCLLTHGNLIANARQITRWLGFTEADRLLTVMPLFHMNAVSVTTMSPLYAGASTVVSPRFSA